MIQIDMQMPKCCDECFALDEHGDYPFCLISQDQRGYTFNTRKKRMPTCPLKEQELAGFIPIDWLMNYAQLPTEFAISEWEKPKKEAKIKQSKSLDKPMSLDDALELLKAQEPRVMTVDEMNQLSNGDTVWVEISDGRLLPMMVEDGTLMRWGYMWRICDEAFCAHEEGECAARAWTSRPDQATREAIPWN